MKLARVACSIFVLSTIGCGGLVRSFRADPVHPGASDGPQKYDSIVLLRETELKITGEPGYERIDREQILVLRPAGRRHARVVLPLDYRSKLVRVRARSFGPEGADEEALADGNIAYAESTDIPGIAFPDFREAIFDVPGASVGDVIETEIHTHHTGLQTISGFVFDDVVPVHRARVIVEAERGFELRWSSSADGALKPISPEMEDDGELRRYTFVQNELPARADKRPHLLRLAVVGKPAELAEMQVFGSWNDVAAWYADLSKGLAQISDDQWADIVREVGTPTAEKLFELVRDRIRYVAYYREGIDGLRPHAAQEVLRLRFGDCKDMSTLLTTLYQRAGIRGAHPVLISTSDAVAFDPELPTPGAFNHMVVALETEGGYVFLDPTDKGHAFGQPGFAQHGQTAVVLDGPQAKLVPVPFPSPSQHGMITDWIVRADGTARLAATWRGLWSAPAAAVAETADRAQVKSWVEDNFLSKWPAVRVVSATITAERGEARLEAELEHQGYEAHVPVRWFFESARDLGFGKRGPLRDQPRHFEERVSLELPAGATGLSLPPAQEMKGAWGSVAWSAKHEGSRISLERKTWVEAKQGAASEEVSAAIAESSRRAVSWTESGSP